MYLQKVEKKIEEQLLVYFMNLRKEIIGKGPLGMDINIKEDLLYLTVYWESRWVGYNRDDDNFILARIFEKNEDMILDRVNKILNKCLPIPVEVLFLKRIPFIEESQTHFVVYVNKNLEEELQYFYEHKDLL